MFKYAGDVLRMLEEKEEPIIAIDALGYIGNIFSLAFFAKII